MTGRRGRRPLQQIGKLQLIIRRSGSKKDAKKQKSPLTNLRQWCKMGGHTVESLPFSRTSPFNMVILPQNNADVKMEIDQF